MNELTVETVPIISLVPDPNNARGHERGIPELAASLTAFGQRKPVVVWGDNVAIAGNGLLEAATSLGWTHIAISRVPSDWDYDKARAFALADNRTAELSEWKLPVLDEIRFDLDANGWDLEQFGFAPLSPPGFGDKDVDDVPEVSKIAKSKLGDLYELGEHRLLCGDATKAEDYERLMGGDKAECIWTDPPYGVEYVGKTKDALTIKNDGAAGLRAMLADAFAQWERSSVEGGAVYIAHPPGALSLTFLQCFIEAGWRLHETLCWNKQTIVMGHSDYHYSHEPILFGYMPGGGRRGRGGAGWYGDNSQKSVLDVAKPSRSESHPTMKPVALVEICIKNSAPVGGIVLDPFGGSGSTLIACEQTGHKCRMIELDPLYVDVIIERWEALTGKKANKLTRGK